MQIVIIPGKVEVCTVGIHREYDDSGWYVSVHLTYTVGQDVRSIPTEYYHGLTLVEAQTLACTALDTYVG